METQKDVFTRWALKKFESFLQKKKYRKTPERYAVLEELFKQEEHLDVETLYFKMKTQKYSISRATVYNTLDLLVECGLAIKHQFHNKNALYEQALTDKPHDHLICNQCEMIKEFTDPLLDELKTRIGKNLNSSIKKHSLVFYGDCTVEACPQLNKL